MHEVYIQVLVETIKENFQTEQTFVEDVLYVNASRWEAWKRGEETLSQEQNQKIKNLFSDYEWMLLQKILRQTVIFPEKRTSALSDYKRMKTKVAHKWLQEKLATVELIPQESSVMTSAYLNLKVTISYGEWGFDDILTFRLPASVQQQIENDRMELLTWVNANLAETYTATNEVV